MTEVHQQFYDGDLLREHYLMLAVCQMFVTQPVCTCVHLEFSPDKILHCKTIFVIIISD